MIDIKSIELRNPTLESTGSNQLSGNVGSRQLATIHFIVHWETIEADLTFYGNSITRNDGGSFIDDGFKLNDTIEIIVSPTSSGTGDNVGSYVISGLTAGQMFVTLQGSGSASGSGSLFTTEIGADYYAIHGTTPITTVDLFYGIIKNTDAPAYLSLIDGETQRYRAVGLDATAFGSESLDVATTNKSWVTGSVTENGLNEVVELGVGTSGISYGYEQYFSITQYFYVSPAILLNQEDSNGDLDEALIPYLFGIESLKYVFKITGGFSLGAADHSTEQGNISSVLSNGDVGFYNQYRNTGASGRYSATSLTLQDILGQTVSNIIADGTTEVRFSVVDSGSGITASSKFIVSVYELPTAASSYSNNGNTAWTNFNVSQVMVTPGGAPQSNNEIQSCSATGTGASTTIEFNLVDVGGTNKKHLIIAETANPAESDVNTNDRMIVLAAYKDCQFHLHIPDNVVTSTTGGMVMNDHPTNDVNYAFTSGSVWVEDGILIRADLKLLKLVGVSDDWNLLLRSVRPEIWAVNSTDDSLSFQLETDSLTDPTSTTRGFILATGDNKNDKQFSQYGSTSTRNNFSLAWATKIRYEQWLAQTNANVTDFPTGTKNWSEYQSGDWSVKLRLYLDCRATKTGQTTQTVTIWSDMLLRIRDYNEQDCPEIVADEIETIHSTSGDNMNGQLSKTVDTNIIARFYGKDLFPCIYQESGSCSFDQIRSGSGSMSNGSVGLDDCPEYYGIIRLDSEDVGGEFYIREGSSVVAAESDSPFSGLSTLVMYPYATPEPYIEVRNTLLIGQLNTSLSGYKVSARLGKFPETICKISIMGRMTGGSAYSHPAIAGFTLNELLVFSLYSDNPYYEQTTWNMNAVSGDDLSFKSPVAGNIKICCSVDALLKTVTGDVVVFAGLVGFDSDDFLLFSGNDLGREVTTSTGFSFNSGLGEVTWPFGSSCLTKISFHAALISDTLSGATTYTHPSLAGLTVQQVMIFVEGQEMTVSGFATITGSTITFAGPVSGPFKVCLVSQ